MLNNALQSLVSKHLVGAAHLRGVAINPDDPFDLEGLRNIDVRLAQSGPHVEKNVRGSQLQFCRNMTDERGRRVDRAISIVPQTIVYIAVSMIVTNERVLDAVEFVKFIQLGAAQQLEDAQ